MLLIYGNNGVDYDGKVVEDVELDDDFDYTPVTKD